MSEPLISLLDKAARLTSQRLAKARRQEALQAITALGDDAAPAAQFAAGWRAAGLTGEPLPVAVPAPAFLPFAAWRADMGWVLVLGQQADGGWKAENPEGTALTLAQLDGAVCVSLPRRPGDSPPPPRAGRLVARAVWARKGVFFDAILATGLVNVLTLAASLYSMQVFDRVIPNNGFNTLWVLTVGVAAAVLMEFLLKQVRSHSIDKACTHIDHQLSEWLFSRMMGIRMEARPSAVGTLASQVKGFEMVRGVLTSTSVFVLADVPFAILFVVVIALVGGGVVWVPIIALPLALLMGVMFQRVIARHTRENLKNSNLKTGLLVEAVDGAESLKACHGDWNLQSRWNALVKETGESDQRIRQFTAWSQNLTVAMQQLGYIAIIATGAWYVADNQLTMGALLACSIISNRAMTPIIQMPGVMVQWAHARAALEGLDRIIALPAEADTAHHALTPEHLEPEYKFERTRFAYGVANRIALELEQVRIPAGQKVGLLGPVGSGKSTLLKLASGLYRPNEGKVFLGGVDLALLAPGVAREAIGYLPQDMRLFSGTLRDNLLLGLADPGDETILEAARKTGLIDLISAQPKGLGLEIFEGGRGVSGGQKQLIGLTRLLLAHPSVWLLDEPTGSMDADTEGRVVALLKETLKPGDTLIVATHKQALLPLLDRLMVVHGGRVLLDGPRDQVLAQLSGQRQGVKA